MDGPSRRYHQRFSCDIPLLIYPERGRDALGGGRLLDISMGGAAVASFLDLRRGSSYEFRPESEDGRDKLRLFGVVVWQTGQARRGAELRYGLNFKLSGRQEGLLKRFIDSIRMECPSKDEKISRDYWSV
ncbi:MAG: PilZ domain-containing protein [Elusimicrobiota bacterium]